MAQRPGTMAPARAASGTGTLPSLTRACAGELIGTYLLAFFGCGSVMSAVITGAQVGLWQVAGVWGFGIPMALYATAAASGPHLNPSLCLSLARPPPHSFSPSPPLPLWGAPLARAVL